jgi:hypothetical protein
MTKGMMLVLSASHSLKNKITIETNLPIKSLYIEKLINLFMKVIRFTIAACKELEIHHKP